ncbi:unnamed protein product [Parnassius mnemosyne]|uniref:PiggyBac transposable element-derived protein domain-containing protein n=1 Tax=Parnassius mnemosyne TaxID=213953 RepID=A0AAV1LXF4_9NEOP
MTSSRPSNTRNYTDEELARYLNDEDSDGDVESAGSETEDQLEIEQLEQTDEEDRPTEVISSNVSNPDSFIIFEETSTTQESTAQESNNSFLRSNIIPFSQRVLRGRNRYVWSTVRPQSNRTSSSNIVHISQGPTSHCRGIKDPLACFELFITDEILDEIVKWTNAEIIIKQQNYATLRSTQQPTDKCEIRALIGIFIISAVLKDNHLSTDELFDSSLSGTRYVRVSTMSKYRYEFLIRCLRFGDKNLR